MRILLVTKSWPSDRSNGGKQRTAHLYEALRRHGSVDVVVHDPSWLEPAERARLAHEGPVHAFVSSRAFTPPFATPVPPPVRRLVNALGRRWDRRRAAHDQLHDYRAVREAAAWRADGVDLASYDLVVCRYLAPAARLGLIGASRLVVDVDDDERQVLASMLAAPFPPSLGTPLVESRLIALRTYLPTLTRRIPELFVADERTASLYDGSRVTWLPNLPPHAGAPSSRESGEGLLTVGAGGWPPFDDGLRWFLREVWPHVRAARPSARFTIASAYLAPDLVALVAASPGVTHDGDMRDVASKVAACAGAVVSNWYGGGSSIKLLEALAAGRPVVATSFASGPYAAHLGSSQGLLAAGDAATMAKNCVLVLEGRVDTKEAGPRAQVALAANFAPGAFQTAVDAVVGRVAAVGTAQRRGAVADPQNVKDGPKISVVVPTFNRRDLVVEAVRSVRAGTEAAFEIIVVDDGSTDGTDAALRAAFGTTITVLTQSNAGPGAARNRGAAAARGDYLLFLDSDDQLLSWTIAELRRILMTDARADVLYVSPHWQGLDAAAAPVPRESLVLRSGLRPADVMVGSIFAGSSCLCVRRATFAASGGFWEARCGFEDYDWLYRLAPDTAMAVLVAPAMVARRYHAASMTEDLRSALAGAERVVENETLPRSLYPREVADARHAHAGRAFAAYVGMARERGATEIAVRFDALLRTLGLPTPDTALDPWPRRARDRLWHPLRAAVVAGARRLTAGLRMEGLLIALGRRAGLGFLLRALPTRQARTPYGVLHFLDEPSHARSELLRFGIGAPSTCAHLARTLRAGDHVLDLAPGDGIAALLEAKLVGRTGTVRVACRDDGARTRLAREAALSHCVLTIGDAAAWDAKVWSDARIVRVDARSVDRLVAHVDHLSAKCEIVLDTTCHDDGDRDGDVDRLAAAVARLAKAGYAVMRLPRRHAYALSMHGAPVPEPVCHEGAATGLDSDLLLTRRAPEEVVASLPALTYGELIALLKGRERHPGLDAGQGLRAGVVGRADDEALPGDGVGRQG